MFQSIRKRISTKRREPFGKAGLTVAIFALVLAMVGGAWAAVGLNSKQKKEVTKIAKKYAGKPGTPGTNGTNGSPGTNGTNGAPGSPGTNGNTVLNGTGAPASGLGADGDFYIDNNAKKIYGPKTAGAWGAGTALKGPEGSPWTAGGTLPIGKTETGSWVMGPAATAFTLAPISFALPLAAELDSTHVHYITEAGTPPAQCEDAEHAGTASAANPEAAMGNLCVYAAEEENAGTITSASIANSSHSGAGNGAGVAGAFLLVESVPAEGNAVGTFAVSGPEAP
jgi:hypothetical protein